MSALSINTTETEDGRNAYDFTSRGTHYTVIECRDGQHFEVFSERKAAAFGVQIKVMSLKEMGERSKALANLAAIISTDAARA